MGFSETRCHLNKRSIQEKPWVKSSPRPVLVIKVLLEHSHTHLFEHCLRLLSQYRAELSGGKSLQGPESLTHLLLVLCRKGLLAPDLHCGPQTSSTDITWEPVGISDSTPRKLQIKQGFQVIVKPAEV